MQGWRDLPKTKAMDAYAKVGEPDLTLTDRLLYAILAQRDKISYQLDEEGEEE